MREEDIVVLRYCENSCYVEPVRLDDIRRGKDLLDSWKDQYVSFGIDLPSRTWNLGSTRLKIGGGQHFLKGRLEIIGVYNARQLSHLKNMLDDAREATATNVMVND